MSLWNTAIEYGFKIVDHLINSQTSANKTHEVTTGFSEEQLLNHLETHKKNTTSEVNTAIKSAIKDAALFFENTVHSESNRILDKIESDQQEKLLSTIKLANFYLEIEDYESAKKLTTDLILLSDYSRNRVQEGKFKWLAPWIISNSTWIAIMKYDTPSTKAITAIDAKFKYFRLELLDLLGSELILRKSCSWIEISDFVNNTGTTIIPKLINVAQQRCLIAGNAVVQKKELSDKVPPGRKQCKKCLHIEFERYAQCPNCGSSGIWYM